MLLLWAAGCHASLEASTPVLPPYKYYFPAWVTPIPLDKGRGFITKHLQCFRATSAAYCVIEVPPMNWCESPKSVIWEFCPTFLLSCHISTVLLQDGCFGISRHGKQRAWRLILAAQGLDVVFHQFTNLGSKVGEPVIWQEFHQTHMTFHHPYRIHIKTPLSLGDFNLL